MWRPWHEDDRPVWAVHCRIDLELDEADQALLLKTIDDTGTGRAWAPGGNRAPGAVVALLVHADFQEVAEYVAGRLLEVATSAAGLPRPRTLTCKASPHARERPLAD
jgi:hypothetical protein